MNTTKTIKSMLIAPCGMNCALCYAYLREKNKCPGCRGSNENKAYSCVNCRIINCDTLNQRKLKFCFSCKTFPCARLKQLDKRYRTKYGMSMIENLGNIKEHGIRDFVKQEKQRWTCPNCDGIICVHRVDCSYCGQQWNFTRLK